MSNLRDKSVGMHEKEMTDRLREGDEEAFRELVGEYQVRVMSLCLSMLHVREEAEDVAQEVFVEVYRSVERFRGESRLSTWIYRIAVNKCLNQIRHRQRRKWFLLPGQLPEKQRQEEIAAPAGDLPSAEIERQQRLQRLWQAIDALPENQRKAFVLSRMEDLSYREVAEIMGTTLPAVESLLQRARINLQQKLWAFYKKERS